MTWYPEQIVCSLLQGKIAFKTIYHWLYSGKRQAPRETRGRFNVDTSIQQRQKKSKRVKRLAIGNEIPYFQQVVRKDVSRRSPSDEMGH